MRIKDIMKQNPITVDSKTLILEARKIMQENNIRRFPVVDKGRLVGITTESDIVRVLIHALGIREEGSPIPIEGLNERDFNQINSIANQHETILLSMISWFREEKNDWVIVLRVKTKRPEPIVQDLKKAGF